MTTMHALRHAVDHDMDMPSSSEMNGTAPGMGMMSFHTLVGMDMLWFSTWMPATAASTFGACVGLFLFAVFHRFIIAFLAANAVRNAVNATWTTVNINKLNKNPTGRGAIRYPAFTLMTDLTMGILEGLSAFIGYALMLAVMVMNAWFFIAILLGIIVGEIAFGRYKRCILPQGAFASVNECC